MAKKKGNLYGVSNYTKNTPKKHGRLKKNMVLLLKNLKNIEVKADSETYHYKFNVSSKWRN